MGDDVDGEATEGELGACWGEEASAGEDAGAVDIGGKEKSFWGRRGSGAREGGWAWVVWVGRGGASGEGEEDGWKKRTEDGCGTHGDR